MKNSYLDNYQIYYIPIFIRQYCTILRCSRNWQYFQVTEKKNHRGAENQENQGVRFIWTDLAIFALSGEGLRCVTGVRFMEFMEEEKLVCGQEGLRWKIFLTARAS